MSIADMTTKCSIEVEVFEFDQLTKKERNRLLREECQTLAEIWSPDVVVAEFTEKIASIGFSDVEVFYSGFGSQGDGACFDATVDIGKVCKHLEIPYSETEHDWSCSINILNRRYNHERAREIEFQICDPDIGSANPELEAEIGEKIEKLRLDLCIQLYRDLESDYHYNTSEEEALNFLSARKFARRNEIETALTEQCDPCEGVDLI
jgi:hypothetical protein